MPITTTAMMAATKRKGHAAARAATAVARRAGMREANIIAPVMMAWMPVVMRDATKLPTTRAALTTAFAPVMIIDATNEAVTFAAARDRKSGVGKGVDL